MTTVWIVLISTGLAVQAAFLYLRAGNRRRALYAVHAREFFARIGPVVEDDETPQVMLDLIAFINQQITEPSAATALRRVLWRMAGNPDPSGNGAKLFAPVKEFLARRPELQKPYYEATTAALFALTYLDRLGWLSRAALVVVNRHHEVAPDVVVDFKRASHNNHGALAAA